MRTKKIELGKDGLPVSGQVIPKYDQRFWLITKSLQQADLGENTQCHTLDGALKYWQNELDRHQGPTEPDWKYARRQKKSQSLVNELCACGATYAAPKLKP